MTPLQKGFSHREEAKTTKISKKKFKNLKSFSGFFHFASRSLKFLRALPGTARQGRCRFFAVKRVFFQWTQ